MAINYLGQKKILVSVYVMASFLWCHFLDPQPAQEFLITRGDKPWGLLSKGAYSWGLTFRGKRPARPRGAYFQRGLIFEGGLLFRVYSLHVYALGTGST